MTGVTKHPLYWTWQSMIQRCQDQNAPYFKHYGGRGITVCDEWLDSRTFVDWVDANLGPKPEGCTLDRIDNDKGYEPGNVRWATHSDQMKNRRSWKWSKDGKEPLAA